MGSWPAATVDLPTLPVAQAPLQNVAYHLRPRALEGCSQLVERRRRLPVEVDLETGVVARLSRPVVSWCVHDCLFLLYGRASWAIALAELHHPEELIWRHFPSALPN